MLTTLLINITPSARSHSLKHIIIADKQFAGVRKSLVCSFLRLYICQFFFSGFDNDHLSLRARIDSFSTLTGICADAAQNKYSDVTTALSITLIDSV